MLTQRLYETDQLARSRSMLVHLPLPQDDPRVRRPDITRAQKWLRWEPRVTLAQGLKSTIAYFKGKVS